VSLGTNPGDDRLKMCRIDKVAGPHRGLDRPRQPHSAKTCATPSALTGNKDLNDFRNCRQASEKLEPTLAK